MTRDYAVLRTIDHGVQVEAQWDGRYFIKFWAIDPLTSTRLHLGALDPDTPPISYESAVEQALRLWSIHRVPLMEWAAEKGFTVDVGPECTHGLEHLADLTQWPRCVRCREVALYLRGTTVSDWDTKGPGGLWPVIRWEPVCRAHLTGSSHIMRITREGGIR